MTDLLQRLRERKLGQWALAYLAGAWVLLQGLDLIGHQFDWPSGVLRGIKVVLGVGFFTTLVLAWYHGERGAQKISGTELLILALLLAIGGTLLWRFARSAQEAARASVTQSNTAASPAVVNDKSIAVLPFENLSEDKANAYFASGIQDEILTRLAKIGTLKVISRTSTQHYASSPDNLPRIAKELGVANILEGSVQKVGDSVRINVQLIRADGDSHLWAETYDRKLDNIFGVESEVATAIAGSLQAQLTGSEQRALALKPTDNPAAYNAYLRGLALNAARINNDNWRGPIAAYADAVRIDPNFALAWAHLAIMRSLAYFNSIDVAENTPDAIKQAADTALRLQPELGEAWLAQGYYRYRCMRDFSGALQLFEEARKRLPNNAQVLNAIGLILRRMGRWEEGLSNMQQAVELDPRNLSLLDSLAGDFLQAMRRFDESRAVIDRELLIAPGNRQLIGAKAQTYMNEGRYDAAAKLVDSLPMEPKDDAVSGVKFNLLGEQGHFDAWLAAQQLLLPKPGEPLTYAQADIAINVGTTQVLLHVGNPATARSLCERAIHTLKPTPTATVRLDNRGLPISLAGAYACIGDKQAALDTAREAVALYHDDAVQKPVAEFVLAAIQAWFGDNDAAIAALPHLLQVPNRVMPGDLQWDTNWYPLRKDPRFQKLIADLQTAGTAKKR